MEPKKEPKADVQKSRSFFLFMSIIVALGITLAGLEWRSITVTQNKELKTNYDVMEEQRVKPSKPKKPKKKPKKTNKVEVVEEEDDIEKELTVQDMEMNENSSFDFKKEEKVKEDKVFMVVENDPTFPGGQKKMRKYINEHVDYPQMAREMDVTGTVIVSFTVEKDGSLTNIKVIKGIGSGCDKEAKKVVKNMPKWKPGKQRGRAVRVNMKVPIRFSLE